jgi:hypothetical protein
MSDLKTVLSNVIDRETKYNDVNVLIDSIYVSVFERLTELRKFELAGLFRVENISHFTKNDIVKIIGKHTYFEDTQKDADIVIFLNNIIDYS